LSSVEQRFALKMNLRLFWEKRVGKSPSKVYLYYEEDRLTFGEFDDRVNQAANAFSKLGVKKGEKVCLILPNIPEFLFSWLGLCKVGGVAVPINTAYTETETEYIVSHSEAVGVVVSEERLDVTLRIQRRLPGLKWIVYIGDERHQPLPDVFRYAELTERMPKSLPGIDIDDTDLACVIYTSGTTGTPKGVMHAHSSVVMTGEAFLLRAGVGPDDRIMAILPLFHINAQFYSTWGAIAAGAGLILIRRFSASLFWRQAVKYEATEFNFVGTIGKMLCARPEEEFRPAHSIRTAVGAGVSSEVYQSFTGRFGIRNVIDAYGLTEVPAVSQNPVGGKIKAKSIGLPAKHPASDAPFTEMKVVDEHGDAVPAMTVGELAVRSPVMMKGYFKEPEKTREAIRDGWFHTGDYAYRDEDGYFFFVDRKKDIIRRRGENISAAEVEGVLLANSKVLEAAVIAVPAELGEDEVLACVVLKDCQTMAPEELIDWCKGRVASFKVPRFIQFRPALPKTATQRVSKPSIRSEADLQKKAYDMEIYKKQAGL
jgi:crotonobetaine/carnitine-CoA ligase